MSDQFVKQRAHPISVALAANLGRWYRDGGQMIVRAPGGGSATVVGGGPSCHGFDRIEGGTVLAVNTSAPRVAQDREIDLLVVREVVPLGEQLSRVKHRPPGHVVVDAQTSAESVRAAHDLAPCVWFIPAQGHLSWLSHLLDVEPIYAGESAMTSSVAIAEFLGCDDVSLIGVDLAFSPDGSAYGEGTAWSSVRVEMRDGTADLGDRGGMVEHAMSVGVPGPPRRETATPVIMEDGSQGWALATWASQRMWLENWAARHPGWRFRNLSGGAKIEGWAPATRAGGPTPGTLRTVPIDGAKVEAEIRRQLRYARDMIEHPHPWKIGDAAKGCPLVDMTAERDRQATSDLMLPIEVAYGERNDLLRRAVDDVARAFGL